MSDEPKIDLCSCTGFRWWYTDHGQLLTAATRWCVCAHSTTWHLDGHGTCVGEVEVFRL